MKTLTVSKLLIAAMMMTLQLCLAQDVAPGVAVVPASNSSQEANQAASTQVPPALAAAGTTAAEALSQIPPLEGPVKLAVVLPLPPRYTDNVTAHGSGVVDAVAPAIPDPAVRVESMQPTAVVADAVLEREAVPSTYQGMLDRHNYYRAWHGAGPLSWSTALANSAAAFASWCSQGHDPNLSMNEGENLWWIEAPGSLSFLQRAVDGWYAEVQDYDYNYPVFSGNTGHFTQLVWRATTQLGCALQACSWGSLVVCRYSARGNVENAFSSNVLPRQATPPQPNPPTPTPPGPQPPTPPSPTPKPPLPSGNPGVPGDGVIPEGHFTRAGCLVAPAKRYWICLDNDANLVLYNSDRKPLWRNTNKASGIGPMRLVMHADGNLYIRDSTDAVMWSTNTAGRGVRPRRFQLQDDGNALIADAQNIATWATYTRGQKKL